MRYPSLGARNVIEPRFMSHKPGECAKSCARRSVCSVIGALEVPVMVC